MKLKMLLEQIDTEENNIRTNFEKLLSKQSKILYNRKTTRRQAINWISFRWKNSIQEYIEEEDLEGIYNKSIRSIDYASRTQASAQLNDAIPKQYQLVSIYENAPDEDGYFMNVPLDVSYIAEQEILDFLKNNSRLLEIINILSRLNVAYKICEIAYVYKLANYYVVYLIDEKGHDYRSAYFFIFSKK
jgi:hypothetical protein